MCHHGPLAMAPGGDLEAIGNGAVPHLVAEEPQCVCVYHTPCPLFHSREVSGQQT